MKNKKIIILLLITIPLFSGCSFEKKIEIDTSKNQIEDEISVIKEETKEGRTSLIGVSSSKDKPLKIGQTGIASRYNAKTDEYNDVDIKLLSVEKINIDDELITKYNNKNDIPIKDKKGFTNILVEYETTLVNYETESFGSDVEMFAEVKNEKDEFIMFNDIKQVIDIYLLEQDTKKFTGETGKVKIMYQVPNESKNYLLKLGAIGKKQVYFKIN